jgi:GTPase SAR1 family protein
VVLVYDVTQRSSFESLNKWMNEVRDSTNNKYYVILLGNKIDLENQRTVSTLEGKSYAEENNFKFFETSAKTNQDECVDMAFHHLIGEITEKVVIAERKAFEEEIKIQRKKTIKFDPEAIEKKGCC